MEGVERIQAWPASLRADFEVAANDVGDFGEQVPDVAGGVHLLGFHPEQAGCHQASEIDGRLDVENAADVAGEIEGPHHARNTASGRRLHVDRLDLQREHGVERRDDGGVDMALQVEIFDVLIRENAALLAMTAEHPFQSETRSSRGARPGGRLHEVPNLLKFYDITMGENLNINLLVFAPPNSSASQSSPRCGLPQIS